MRARKIAPVRETRVDRVVLRLDQSSHSTTPQGYLRVWGTVVSGDEFLEYDRIDGAPRDGYVEFVPAAEVSNADSLETLKHVPVTFNHPPEPLTTDNTGQYKKGTVIGVKMDGGNLRVHHQIENQGVINDVKAAQARGEVFELSLGYTALIDRTPGKFGGRRYDAIQRNRIYNHVAIVPEGRAEGATLDRIDSIRRAFRCDRLAVSKTRQNKGDAPMAKQVKVGADTFEVATQVADKMQAMEDELTRLSGNKDQEGEGGEGDEDDEEETEDAKKDRLAKEAKDAEEANAKDADGSNKRTDGITAKDVSQIIAGEFAKFRADAEKREKKETVARKKREDAATVLASDITSAKPYLPQSFKFDGKTSADVLHAAILSANAEMKATIEPYKTDAGQLRGFLAALHSIQPPARGSSGGSQSPGDLNMTPLQHARKVRADQIRLTQAQILHRRIGRQAAEQVRWEMAQNAQKASG